MFENLDETSARSIEAELIGVEEVESSKCYNMVAGGGLPPNLKGVPKSDEHKAKISEAAKKSWLNGKRIQHKQSEEFKQNMRVNNPSKSPEVNRIQSQKMREYYAKMTPEQRSERSRRLYETRMKNKETMEHV